MTKLAIYINDLKLTYASVAKEAGYTRSYIRLLAVGEKENPSKGTMKKISDSLCKVYDERAKSRRMKLVRPTIEILFYSQQKNMRANKNGQAV